MHVRVFGPCGLRRIIRDLLDRRLPGKAEFGRGVGSLDDRLASLCDDHIAGEQQPDPAVSGECLVRQGRVAGAEDEVFLPLLAELVAQGRLHVDVGE